MNFDSTPSVNPFLKGLIIGIFLVMIAMCFWAAFFNHIPPHKPVNQTSAPTHTEYWMDSRGVCYVEIARADGTSQIFPLDGLTCLALQQQQRSGDDAKPQSSPNLSKHPDFNV